MSISAVACEAKAIESERKADGCFSPAEAGLYRTLASQWRQLGIEAIMHDALISAGLYVHPASRA
jgi:hypothetical protein